MPRERLPIGELGTINTRKLPTGKWEARARIRGKDGRTHLLQATAETKARATTALKAKATKTLPTGTSTLTGQTRLTTAAEKWVTTLTGSGLKPSTIRTYEQATRLHIIPLLGELSIQEITTSRVTEFLQQVAEPRPTEEHNGATLGGPTSAAHAKICLSLIYKMLIHDGVLEHSPVTHAQAPRRRARPVKAMTVEDILGIRQDILAWGAQRVPGPPRQADLLLDFVDVLAGTGMRPGEVLALSWRDISFATGVIFVHSTLTQVKGQGLVVQPTPKSLYSERGLRMPELVERVLWARRSRAGHPVDGPVFATRNGTYISDSNMRRMWRAAVSEKYSHVSFADYRKAVATLIERAEGMEAAGKALGHSSPEITRKYYVERDQIVDFSEVIDSALALELE